MGPIAQFAGRVFLLSIVTGMIAAAVIELAGEKPSGLTSRQTSGASDQQKNPGSTPAARPSAAENPPAPAQTDSQAGAAPPSQGGTQAQSGSPVAGAKLSLVFKDAVPSNFANGRAKTCSLIADVYNRTKYHLNKLTFKIGAWEFELDQEMNAYSQLQNHEIQEATLPDDVTCFGAASYIAQNAADAGIFDCSIPGLAEGDCQELIEISSRFDGAAIDRLRTRELAAGARQMQPVRDAIARAGLNAGSNLSGQIPPERLRRFNDLLDAIVAADSQFWSWNKYQRGSMETAPYYQPGANASLTLKGNYRYTDGSNGPVRTGWIEASFKDGALVCIRFHDFKDECRALRLPDVPVE